MTRVWRTGVGIDRRGNLIYVVANDQTVITLAKILQHAGAVRAMEFDINPEWHTLITYTHQLTGSSPQWSSPSRCSRPPAISSPTTVTSSPSTGAARAGHGALQVARASRTAQVASGMPLATQSAGESAGERPVFAGRRMVGYHAQSLVPV